MSARILLIIDDFKTKIFCFFISIVIYLSFIRLYYTTRNQLNFNIINIIIMMIDIF